MKNFFFKTLALSLIASSALLTAASAEITNFLGVRAGKIAGWKTEVKRGWRTGKGNESHVERKPDAFFIMFGDKETITDSSGLAEKVRTLSIDPSKVTGLGLEALKNLVHVGAATFNEFTGLIELDLSQFDDAAQPGRVRELEEGLFDATPLQVLQLCDTKLTALPRLPVTLRFLQLNRSGISENDLKQIIPALKTGLRCLSICDNAILLVPDEVLAALLEAPELEGLWLTGNPVNKSSEVEINLPLKTLFEELNRKQLTNESVVEIEGTERRFTPLA